MFTDRFLLSRKLLNITLLIIAIAATAQSIVFNCRFSVLNQILVVGSAYTCEVLEVLVVENEDDSLTLQNLTGRHVVGKTSDDVGLLLIVDQTFNSIPKNIETFFPNLVALGIERSKLLTISAIDLQPFPKLKVLGLYGNDLTSLHRGLFEFNPELVMIEFSANQIEFIDSELLENLDYLQHFYILNNQCVSENADNRDEVLAFVAKLPYVCPTVAETCTCADEIADQNNEIDLLKEINAAMEQRLMEVERQLREISSMPCVKWTSFINK